MKNFLNITALVATLLNCHLGVAAEPAYLSPTALAATADGQILYVACATAGQVAVFDTTTRKIARTIAVPDSPVGLALAPDGKTLYVTCAAPESTVCVVDTAKAKVTAKIPAGHTTLAPVLSPDGKTLFVCNRFNNEVAFIELASHKTVRRVRVPREPIAAAVTPDGKFLFVANHLHAGRADVDVVTSSVSVIDVATGKSARRSLCPTARHWCARCACRRMVNMQSWRTSFRAFTCRPRNWSAAG